MSAGSVNPIAAYKNAVLHCLSNKRTKTGQQWKNLGKPPSGAYWQSQRRSLHYSENHKNKSSPVATTPRMGQPAATVNAQLTASIKHDAEKSPLIRTSGFSPRKRRLFQRQQHPPRPQPNTSKLSKSHERVHDVDTSDSILHAFGILAA